MCGEADTVLAWYRRLIVRKFDGSRHRGHPASNSRSVGHASSTHIKHASSTHIKVDAWWHELLRESATHVFVEPVNRALPGEIGGRFVVAFRRCVAMEAVNGPGVDIALVR